jgi:endoglucanase
MRAREWGLALIGVVIAALAVGSMAGLAVSAQSKILRNDLRQQCADPYSSHRDPSNPLMLHTRPGSDPLTGASFFVNGPAHGAAAGAIARLLGIDTGTPVGAVLPSFSESESWATFDKFVQRQLPQHPSAAHDIGELSKIAAQPEVQRISSYSQGGGAGAIFSQAQKLLCHNFTADPQAIGIINTYFLHADLGGCPTNGQIAADRPAFERRVSELAQAIGNRPVVMLLETDGLGSTGCISKSGSLGQWEQDLRYEVDTMASLPHAVVYVEGGYSDANSPSFTARALNKIDVRKIRGFYTNDTHLNWTSKEIKWGQKISSMTHGAHFIINTAQNGHGPLLNPHPSSQGVENLCNPPGRGLGPLPTTSTGVKAVDAFLWTSPPGNSSGSCNGGTPSGSFWAARAISLAEHANGKLGPGYPSRPY